MVYKRVSRPPLNIREFYRTHGTTDDDLLKVTLEDGGRLYFALKREPNIISDPKWRLDSGLLPVNLTELLRQYNLESRSDFVLANSSGAVGSVVRLDIEHTPHWQLEMWFVSDAAIKSIRPARRPRKPDVPVLNGKSHSERASDYH